MFSDFRTLQSVMIGGPIQTISMHGMLAHDLVRALHESMFEASKAKASIAWNTLPVEAIASLTGRVFRQEGLKK